MTSTISGIGAQVQDVPAFSRGDIVWQTDPGGLWDSAECFVQVFAVPGRQRLTYLDFEFGAAGSGSDGLWGVWGLIDNGGLPVLLTQGNLPNTSAGLARYVFGTEINISAYDSIALAQDPGAASVTQPVKQGPLYPSPNAPAGPNPTYGFLGTHTHNAVFTSTIPVIGASDAFHQMQKWCSIGVR